MDKFVHSRYVAFFCFNPLDSSLSQIYIREFLHMALASAFAFGSILNHVEDYYIYIVMFQFILLFEK